MEGLKQKNYEVFITNRFTDHELYIKKIGMKYFHHSDKPEIPDNFDALLHGKFAIIMPRHPLTRLKKLEFKTHKGMNLGDSPVKFIKDDIHKEIKGISMLKNDLFWNLFHDAFQRLFEAGIADLQPFIEFSMIDYFKVHDKNNLDCVVLSLQILDAGFYVWLVSILMSIIAFMIELLFHRIHRRVIQNCTIIQVKNHTVC